MENIIISKESQLKPTEKKSRKKVIKVHDVLEKNKLIEFIYHNKERFSFYVMNILDKFYLCCIDELYEETEIIGIIDTKKELDAFEVYFIKPTTLSVPIEIDDEGFVHVNRNGSDSFEINKTNWGVRLIVES